MPQASEIKFHQFSENSRITDPELHWQWMIQEFGDFIRGEYYDSGVVRKMMRHVRIVSSYKRANPEIVLMALEEACGIQSESA